MNTEAKYGLCSDFTFEWWGWLLATGVFMACTWGSKVNGILTVFAIGAAVLVDLWDILDYRKNASLVCLNLSFGLPRF